MRPVAAPRERLTPLETVWGMPYGRQLGVDPLPRTPAGPTGPAGRAGAGGVSALRAAVEDAVLPALRRPPCLVSFSGGRDSSVVLAVATAVARREGLPDPVPYSHRFPAVPDSHESPWQELVVGALDLGEWQRPRWSDEMDVLGPVARAALRRDGVLPPFNGHLHEPVFAAAAGGSVLTGIGGDELFAPVERYPVVRVAARRAPLRWRRAPSLLFTAAAPGRWRARRTRRHLPVGFGWLRPPAARALRAELALDRASEPLRWDVSARTWAWPGRILQVAARAKERAAGAHDVLVAHPFACAPVLAAAATTFGWAGPRGRAAEMPRHFGDLLPARLFAREDKAGFDGAFWAGPGREFARRWRGGGLDGALADLVDPEALRAEWLSAAPDLHSLTLLQHAWLAQEGAAQGAVPAR
ncbi:asparagine synthase-related protein [Kineococcus sp. SYSU DK005]|uniref:asparagine synthase-related protein n=1 Tax=Kineococcus sp. SYSU DK005 TaxID=3383126 RepID=UPI003D7E8007